MEGEEKKGLGDKFLNFIFKKRNLYLILIILLGIILRFILAANIGPLADEMNVAIRSIDVHKSGTMNSIDQSHSFYFLNEVFYKVLGRVSLFTSRFSSIFFGILSILMIYLIVMKLYKSRKIALVACFLVAISGFQIRFSLAEMDITMAFFVLLSTYTFILALYERKDGMYYFSAVFLGLAIAIKTFAGIWVLSYLAFLIFYFIKNKEYRKEYLSKKGVKIIVICIIIIIIAILPTLIANYLLYKDKGIVDLQMSRFLDINKDFYKGLGGIESPFMLSQLKTGLKEGFYVFWKFDAIISILAVLGFIVSFRRYKEANMLLFFWFIFVFLFISGTAWLATHFVFNTLIFSIFASLFLVKVDRLVRKKNMKKFLTIALIVIFIVNMWVLWPHLTSKTAISKMRSFAIDNIGENELVIVDQRVFRGRTALMFNDKAYIELLNFNAVLGSLDEIEQQEVPVKTYFIECVPDDCGWGTIKDQSDLNQSVEEFIDNFKMLSQERAIINGGGGYGEEKGEPYFKVYETNLQMKPVIIEYAKQTHSHYFYPVGWEGDVYDRYTVYNPLDQIINKLGFFIFYVTIILEVISPLIIIWFFRRKRITQTTVSHSA